jgi:hypothetical protein
VSHKDAAAKVGKLKAVTVDHGTTPAEARNGRLSGWTAHQPDRAPERF